MLLQPLYEEALQDKPRFPWPNFQNYVKKVSKLLLCCGNWSLASSSLWRDSRKAITAMRNIIMMVGRSEYRNEVEQIDYAVNKILQLRVKKGKEILHVSLVL